MRKPILLAAFLLMAALLPCAAENVLPPEPFGATPDAAQLAWHEVELYGLVCYNMATFTNEEWAFGDTPVGDFNPTDFCADSLVLAARDGGLRGLVVVAKHHDGFCLWPTATTDYSIANTPFRGGRGDLVREMGDACRRHGLKFGVYISPWDRNHPEYGKPGYVEVFREQWRELMSGYGELFMLWLDGANGGTGYYGGARDRRTIDRHTYYGWDDVFAMMRSMQPNAVIFSDVGPGVRWVGNERGVAGDPCWATIEYPDIDGKPAVPGLHFPAGLLEHGTRKGSRWVPAEADVSIRPGWFYHPEENERVRTAGNLAELYFTSIGRGAALNLGLPPMPSGRLHPTDIESLRKFGKWQEETFTSNLAGAASVTARFRGGDPRFAPENLLDGNRETYWATDEGDVDPQVTFEFERPVRFNVVGMREYLPLGQRVEDWAVDVWRDDHWAEVAAGTAIGSRRLVRLPAMEVERVRLRLINGPVVPALSGFSLYLEPDWIREGVTIREHHRIGVPRKGWSVHGVSYAAPDGGAAGHAIDGNISTLWHTHGPDGERGAPQWIEIDMGAPVDIAGFLCTPRQDGTSRAMVDRYSLHVRDEGGEWRLVHEGEFGNIAASPTQREIVLDKVVSARYFRFTALGSVNGVPVSVADLGVVAAAENQETETPKSP